jgi:hypothetical protein
MKQLEPWTGLAAMTQELANQSIANGGSRFCLSQLVREWRLPPLLYTQRCGYRPRTMGSQGQNLHGFCQPHEAIWPSWLPRSSLAPGRIRCPAGEARMHVARESLPAVFGTTDPRVVQANRLGYPVVCGAGKLSQSDRYRIARPACGTEGPLGFRRSPPRTGYGHIDRRHAREEWTGSPSQWQGLARARSNVGWQGRPVARTADSVRTASMRWPSWAPSRCASLSHHSKNWTPPPSLPPFPLHARLGPQPGISGQSLVFPISWQNIK